MRPVVCGTLFAAGVVFSASVYAQQPAQPGNWTVPGDATQPGQPPGTAMRDQTVNRHFGLFLRPDLGVGYMSISEPSGTSLGDLTFSGAAGFAGFAIGGAVQENVILGVHIYDGVIVNPTVSASSGQSASSSDTTAAMLGIGPEFTYYIMPANVYLSATVALTRMSLTINNLTADSNAGIGARLALGKEWWASDHWGLGVVGHFSYSSNQDSGANAPTLSTWGVGVAFSATYN